MEFSLGFENQGELRERGLAPILALALKLARAFTGKIGPINQGRELVGKSRCGFLRHPFIMSRSAPLYNLRQAGGL